MRAAHQWGLRPFARAVNIDPGYLCLIESGKTAPPSDEFLMRMAALLDVPVSTLFATAGRLPPDITSQFWQHLAVPPILSTIPGMTLADAQTFCQQVLDSLPQPATA
jgi:transcriptional regulator with XRE-family HTH domain